MTNDEINEAVARKLGWRINEQGFWQSPDGLSKVYPFNYCHSIEAAWEVVEYLHARGYFVRLLTGGYAKKFTQVDIQHEAFGPRGKSHCQSVIADSVPMTICLAFLKLP